MYGPDDDLSIKRRALLGAVATITGGTAGCFDDTGMGRQNDMGTDTPPPCPIDWQPHALSPVFYGWRDYGKEDGAPGPTRVFYPSLDGSPHTASFLEGCAHFPLILFAHGQCDEDAGENYKTWKRLPAWLARAGYIVALPEIPWKGERIPTLDTRLGPLDGLGDWMHESWEHRRWLSGKSFMGVAGHSWGAVLSARYAVDNDVEAYASIAGKLRDDPNTLLEFKELEIPKLFCWGEVDRKARRLSPSIWESMREPKHKATFNHARHWDFLQSGQSSCQKGPGTCSRTPQLTTILTVMFFGEYLTRFRRDRPSDAIPASLIPPVHELPTIEANGGELDRDDYATGYMHGFYFEDSDCHVKLTWNTGTKSGTKTVTDTGERYPPS